MRIGKLLQIRQYVLSSNQKWKIGKGRVISSVSDPHWFQYGSGFSILGQNKCGTGSRQEIEKIRSWKKKKYFLSKLQFNYPQASIEDIQATGIAFSPRKRTSSTLKLEISSLFSIYVGHFCSSGPMRVRKSASEKLVISKMQRSNWTSQGWSWQPTCSRRDSVK